MPVNSVINLSSLDGTNGFAVNGINNNDIPWWQGSNIGSGDINGDGITDLLISAATAPANNATGQSYVIYGSQAPFPANWSLSSLNGTNGFVINGINPYDSSGASIDSGDINGDGIDDLLIGAPVGSTPAGQFGQSYVVYGSRATFPASLNLSSLNGTNGFAINGISLYDRGWLGMSMGSGDINGDGIDDVLIGSPNANALGQIYVVYGSRATFPASFNLSNLNGTDGFVINGINNLDNTGWSISSGDINGDGVDDVLIGAPDAPSRAYIGQGYVVFGSQNLLPASFNLSSLNGTNGFIINGVDTSGAFDKAGASISSGDINGDGVDDVLITAPGAEYTNEGTGQGYVIYGSRNPFPASLSLSSLDGNNGFRVWYGCKSMQSADINGDGIADLVIGASSSFTGNQGYIIYGSNVPFPSSFDITTNLDRGFAFNTYISGDGAGSFIGTGDINGDNITDVLISAPFSNTYQGKSYVVYGELTPVQTTNAWTTAAQTTSLITTAAYTTSPITTTPHTTNSITTAAQTTIAITPAPLTTNSITTAAQTTIAITSAPLTTETNSMLTTETLTQSDVVSSASKLTPTLPDFGSSLMLYSTLWQLGKNAWQGIKSYWNAELIEKTMVEPSFDKAIFMQRLAKLEQEAIPYYRKEHAAQDDLRWHIEDLQNDFQKGFSTQAELNDFTVSLEDAETRIKQYKSKGYRSDATSYSPSFFKSAAPAQAVFPNANSTASLCKDNQDYLPEPAFISRSLGK